MNNRIENDFDETTFSTEPNVNVDEVMKKYDKESRTRTFTGAPMWIVRGLLVAFALWCIVQALFIPLPPQQSRSIFLACIMAFAFILYPASKKANKDVNYIAWYDIVLAVLSLVVFLYWTFNYEALANMSIRAYFKDYFQQALAFVALLLLFEACRRVTGIPIIIVSALFLGFAFINGTIINNREFLVTAGRILYTLYYTLEGFFGTPIGVCTEFIGLFIIFGALLEKSCNESSMTYRRENDHPPCTGWNQPSANFSYVMHCRPECRLAFALENAYFGCEENKVSAKRLIELGKAFGRALHQYIEEDS